MQKKTIDAMIRDMKIALNRADQAQVRALIEVLSHNIDASTLFNDFIASEDNISLASHYIKSKSSKDYTQYWIDHLHFNKRDPQMRKLIDHHLQPALHQEHCDRYSTNPYLITIHAPAAKFKKWVFETQSYKPYELFVVNDVKCPSPTNYRENLSIGYFDQSFSFLSVSQNNKNWMSITPNEINTMAPHIERAKGAVLVLGLGLGYFPFMISMKQAVTSITIIEKDADLIDFFNSVIINQFPHRDKIKIVHADAYDYLATVEDHTYNYVFVDIWRTADDALPLYYRCLPYAAKLSTTHFDYWLIDSLIAIQRRLLLTILSEILDGATPSIFTQANSEYDQLINAVYQSLDGVEITSYQDVEKLLSDRFILSLEVNL